MQTWLGPFPGEAAVIDLGPIVVEKWRRQPQRTLQFGSASSKDKKGRGQGAVTSTNSLRVGPGLSATVAASKGHPHKGSDTSTLCAGVQLRLADGEVPACSGWYCPCDVRVTVIGHRCSDLTRTIRWVLTPQNDEAFFSIAPLSDIEDLYLSDRGALSIRAQLTFLLSQPEAPLCHNPLPLGVHGSVIQSLGCGFALAGADLWRSSLTWSRSKLAAVGVSRSGAFIPGQGNPPSNGSDTKKRASVAEKNRAPSEAVLVPGLLPACGEPPCAYAQEIIPGLMIASEDVMSKLVELHEVGVSSLVEVGTALASEVSGELPSPTSLSSASQDMQRDPLCHTVRRLRLRGLSDSVELVEDSACIAEVSEVSDVAQLVQTELDEALSGNDGAEYAVVFPREGADTLSCAAVVATVVAQRFGISLAEATRYVQSRWDVPVADVLASHMWGDDAECCVTSGGIDGKASRGDDDGESGRLLAEFAEAFGTGATEKEISSKFGEWVASAGGSARSYCKTINWSRKMSPWPGLQVEVDDSGWGSVSEVFRAIEAFGCAQEELASVPSLTLLMRADLPKGEVLEVPNEVQVGDVSWHLSSLVCRSGEISSAKDDESHNRVMEVQPQLCLLRGEGEWLLEDGRVFPLQRLATAKAANHWLCTSDTSAKVAVYLRNHRPTGSFPSGKWTGRKVPKVPPLPPQLGEEGGVILRIVTEKALQQHEGELRGAGDLHPSSVIVVPRRIDVGELKRQIQQAVKIPAERQHLLWLPDKLPSNGAHWVRSVDELTAALGKAQTLTVLLRFASDASELADGLSAADDAQPSKALLFCRYFDSESLQYFVLGVLLASPSDYLANYEDWVLKRLAMVAGDADGSRAAEARACFLGTDPGSMVPLYMDRPLCEQKVSSGSVILFEKAPCGRKLMGSGERRQSPQVREAALLHLLQPTPPLCLLGCIVLGVGGGSASDRGKESRRHRCRSALQTLAAELGLPELLQLPMRGPPPLSKGTQPQAVEIVFQAILDPGLRQAQLMAEDACQRFARLGQGAWCTWCQERSSRYQLRELFLTVTSHGRGVRMTFHSMAKHVNVKETFMARFPEESVPPLLKSALAFSRPGLVLDDGLIDTGLSSPLALEGEVASMKTMSVSWNEEDDATDPISPTATGMEHVASVGDMEADAEADAVPTESEPAAQEVIVESEDATLAPQQQAEGSSTATFKVAPGPQPKPRPTGAATKHIRLLPQPALVLQQQHQQQQLSPSSASAPPVKSEEAARAAVNPPIVHSQVGQQQAMPSQVDRRVEVVGEGPSRAGRRSMDEAAASQSEAASSSPRKGIDEGAMIRTVRKMLHSTVDELMALLSHARTLNLTEDIHHVERRLLSLFALRGLPQDLRRELPPRSATLSRSSSCESGFEDHVGKEVARFVLNSTPGEVTQPSTPRSLVHTPGSRPRADSRQWPDLPDENLLLGADITAGGAYFDPGLLSSGSNSREVAEGYFSKAARFDRAGRVMGSHHHGPGMFMWHTNPFSVSRTPNIRTPVGHCSPARSPTSISGHCSPIPGAQGPGGLPSGVASPNQRRSRSGYSSPATDRSHLGPAFFVGTANAHSGLMHRLMSLREAREEMED